MKKLILIALAITPLAMFGQSVERQVIASLGGYATASGISASYTLGEPVIATVSASGIILTQGFQQSEGSTVGIEELGHGLSVNVYPNPATNDVTIEIETTSDLNVNATVYDMHGKQTGVSVSNLRVNGKAKASLDVSSLSAGQYLISFTDKSTTLGTARILKVN